MIFQVFNFPYKRLRTWKVIIYLSQSQIIAYRMSCRFIFSWIANREKGKDWCLSYHQVFVKWRHQLVTSSYCDVTNKHVALLDLGGFGCSSRNLKITQSYSYRAVYWQLVWLLIGQNRPCGDKTKSHAAVSFDYS